MTNNTPEYRYDKRIIAYVDLSVKQEIVDAVKKGLAYSVSSLVSDILKKNCQSYLRDLESENRNKAAAGSTDSIT